MVYEKETRLGAAFEARIGDALADLARRCPCKPVRLYDTKSARGAYLPAQPADWIVASPTGGHLIEAKASDVFRSLRAGLSDLVKPEQAAHHRLWARAGQPCWFLFYSRVVGLLELWRGEIVGECRAQGKVLPAQGHADSAIVVDEGLLTNLLEGILIKGRG